MNDYSITDNIGRSIHTDSNFESVIVLFKVCLFLNFKGFWKLGLFRNKEPELLKETGNPKKPI